MKVGPSPPKKKAMTSHRSQGFRGGAVADDCQNRSFLPERTFAARRTVMGSTSAPRRRVAVLSTAGRGVAAKSCSASRTYRNQRLHPSWIEVLSRSRKRKVWQAVSLPHSTMTKDAINSFELIASSFFLSFSAQHNSEALSYACSASFRFLSDQSGSSS